MKRIILNCNDCFAAYKFRLDLIKDLQKTYDVHVIAGFDEYTKYLIAENIKVHMVEINKTGTSIIGELKLYKNYRKLFKELKPDIIINYTIKPHLYATLASGHDIKIINVVPGLCSLLYTKKILSRLLILFYRLISKKVSHYVFLNNDDYNFFLNNGLIKRDFTIINGEGVNLNNFYPFVDFSRHPTFIFIGRLVKEKGIIEYLEASKIIKERYPHTQFLIAGSFYRKHSAINREIIKEYEKGGYVRYLGYCLDINEILRDVHCVVLPSYREGLPISLVEGLASKKIVIATDVVGSKEVVIDGYNGFLVDVKSSVDLAKKMEKYLLSINKEILHNNALLSAAQYDVNYTIAGMKTILDGLK